MNIKYRQFKKSDREIIARFVKSLYHEDSGEKAIFDGKINRTFNELMKHPDKGAVMVIEDGSEIIGYSILINFWSNEYGGNIIDIDELYIKNDYRNKGIGTKFIRYLIDHKFNDSVAIQLETMPSNKKARRLYERLGFKKSPHHFFYEY